MSVSLDAETIDAIAEAVAARLMPGALPLLTVAEKAAQLKVSEFYVRQHAEALGGLPLPAATGDGKRARTAWRFPADSPLPPAPGAPVPVPPPPRQRSARTSRRAPSEVLPIRGRAR